jgi:predicted unusual protein kinase regulating ubiquinone biosynthesis (AarF/ABC1/UbiB family)
VPLVVANAEEKLARDRLTYEPWGEPLPMEQWLERERRLCAHPWARDTMTWWLWRGDDGREHGRGSVRSGDPSARRDESRQRGARAIFQFAFGAPLKHGIFNSDPHPGNYLVLDGAKVGFVDFGSCAALSEEMHAADRRLWLAMIHRDGETLRHAAHEEGLVAEATVFEGSTWREWEKALAAPFLTRGDFTLSPRHVARLITLTGELLRARRIALPPNAILLWRQRLGALAVIAALSPKLPFRKLLADLLDDGRNPISLYDRWR